MSLSLQFREFFCGAAWRGCAIGAALSMFATLGLAKDWTITGSTGAHDPTIIKEGNTWWCFVTGSGVPIKSSPDGMRWSSAGRLFDAELPWWRDYAPNMGKLDVWAPDLHVFGGRTWCYYAVSEFGRNNSAIGLKSCTSIAAGDWRDDGLVISSSAGLQSYNAIDPTLTVDAAGNPWLAFGSFFSGIQLVRLDPATMKPTGSLSTIATRPNGIEAPNIVYANGYYYLFVSIDVCCQGVNSTYKISYGRSRDITGPYVDKSNVSMRNGGGTLLEVGGVRWKGPGGQDVYKNGSAWIIARHAYDANNNGTPTLLISDLYWDADSWPAYSVSGPPTISVQPVGATIAAGGATTLNVEATGADLSFQWNRDGAAIAGATEATFTATSAGTYTAVVSNSDGSATSNSAVVIGPAQPVRPVQVAVPAGDASAQIVNLSTRGIVAKGENVLIAGFVVVGSAPKKLLILASGLNLSRRFGLGGEVGRPRISLQRDVGGSSVVVAENNDWQVNAAEIAAAIAKAGATPLSESSDPAHGDAGLVVTVPPAGYTVIVAPDAGSANQDGIGLVEIYDLTPTDGSRLINISSRGRIEGGARQMFVGVSIGGSGRERLMIRGIGPTLGALGVSQFIADPSLTLYQSSNQAVVGTNDDWWTSAQGDQTLALFPKLGAFTLSANSKDAAILQLFSPGGYSAIISPGGSAAGVALAEIYEANAP